MIRWKFHDPSVSLFKSIKSATKNGIRKNSIRYANTNSSNTRPKQPVTLISSIEDAPPPAVSGLTVISPPLIPVHSVATHPKEPEMTVKATFYAKQTAAMRGIDLRTVHGSGPDGTILVSDLPSPSPENKCIIRPPNWRELDHVDIQLSEYRVALSKMRSEAKSYIPHYSLEAELDVGKLLKLRSELISKLKAQHNADTVPKMTINDFIIKASALACMKVPEVNSSFMDDSIRKHDYVNISFAVDTKSRDLILSPVICNAHEKGLFQISTEVGMLINKARAGKCQPDEIHGGTFSISNLGMVGSLKNFASIVYPPQAAVIAIGGIQKTLVPTDDNNYETISTMQVTLSCDHRVVDGAIGANWLKIFKNLVENPLKLLL